MSAEFRQLLKDIRESVSGGESQGAVQSVQGGGCSESASRVAHALILCVFMYLYYMKVGDANQAALAAANALTILKENGYSAAMRIWNIISSRQYDFYYTDLGAIPLAYGALKTLVMAQKQYVEYHGYVCYVLTAGEEAYKAYCTIM